MGRQVEPSSVRFGKSSVGIEFYPRVSPSLAKQVFEASEFCLAKLQELAVR